MDIFISWSGERSRAVASELAQWLPKVIQRVRPWMSDRDIETGERWPQAIAEQLAKCQIGILCVTPENADAPWLLFEAGALSKTLHVARVCPLLLGMAKSELRPPLSHFQASVFGKEEVFKLLGTINKVQGRMRLADQLLADSFQQFWPDLENRIRQIAAMRIESTSLKAVLQSLHGHGIMDYSIGRVVHFSEGFESHALYQAITDIAQKRLYVFGRKNRKIFDKEHEEFVSTLATRLAAGFDFRCLFLDPRSPSHILTAAHEDTGFELELKLAIQSALRTLGRFHIDPDSVCRTYNFQRSVAFAIADDVLLYTSIRMNDQGRARKLTKCSFEVVDTQFPTGKELLELFTSVWDKANPISKTVTR